MHVWYFIVGISFTVATVSGRVSAETNTTITNVILPFWIRDPESIQFYLYPDPGDKNFHEEIQFDDEDSLFKSSYNSNKSLILIIHGFLKSYQTPFPQTLKNSYLKNGFGEKANIILVDWGKLASPIPAYLHPRNPLANFYYGLAVSNVPIAGRRVAQFIMFLKEWDEHFSITNTHIVGFSLGAHVSGIAGDHLKQNSSETIGRITGLDPAGPIFDQKLQQRLKRSDATFVDVVHSDVGRNGIVEDLGHVDFYPNGGLAIQPGCLSLYNLLDILIGSCSHNRAWQYYVRSLEDHIGACQCDDYQSFRKFCHETCPNMTSFGERVPSTARGKYFLDIEP